MSDFVNINNKNLKHNLILTKDTIDSIVKLLSFSKNVFRIGTEFEIRFPQLNKLQFQKINDIIENDKFYKKKINIKSTVDILSDNIRLEKDEKGVELYYEYKKEKQMFPFFLSDNVRIKMSLSDEYKIDENKIRSKKVLMSRMKKRIRYEYSEFYIDLTHITTSKDGSIIESYEVEIELKSIFDIKYLISLIKYIIFAMYPNRISFMELDSEKEIRQLYKDILPRTTSKMQNSIFENKPRNFKLKDLENFNHSVTNKLNGINFFLFFSEKKNNLYLINNSTVEYICNYQSNVQNKDIVIQGELFKNEINKNILHIFDSLIINGELLTDTIHSERMAKFEKVLNFLNNVIKNANKNDIFEVVSKRFYGLDSKENNSYNNLINCKNKLLKDENGNIDYEINDGFIFTPLTEKYINNVTLKYKFPETMTIDFLIRLENQSDKIKTFNLFVYNKKQEIVKFVYDNFDSFFMTTTYEKDGPLFDLLKDEMIVECKYDTSNKSFIPYRIRFDKILPNFIDVAKDVFNDILYPITLKNLEESFKNKFEKSIPKIQDEIFDRTSIQSTQILLPENVSKKLCDSLIECVLYAVSLDFRNSDEIKQNKILRSSYEYFNKDINAINNIQILSDTFNINIFRLKENLNNTFEYVEKGTYNTNKNIYIIDQIFNKIDKSEKFMLIGHVINNFQVYIFSKQINS